MWIPVNPKVIHKVPRLSIIIYIYIMVNELGDKLASNIFINYEYNLDLRYVTF